MQNVMVLYLHGGKWDMKFMNYNFKVSGNKTNTIQFSIDVLNIGNLLNSDWE
jgi:DNA polymerase III alpha subunit (gram-positive type)